MNFEDLDGVGESASKAVLQNSLVSSFCSVVGVFFTRHFVRFAVWSNWPRQEQARIE